MTGQAMNFERPKVTTMNLNSPSFAPLDCSWAYESRSLAIRAGAKLADFCTPIELLAARLNSGATRTAGQARGWHPAEGSRQQAEGSRSVDFVDASFRAAKPPTAHRPLTTDNRQFETHSNPYGHGSWVLRKSAEEGAKTVLSKTSPTGRSKPRYEIRPRCSKSTAKKVVFAISARDTMRGFVPSNRVGVIVDGTVKTPGAIHPRFGGRQ